MFWVGLTGQVLVFGGIAYGTPTMALHLASYEGFTKVWIGCYFATAAFTYIMNSLLIATYCKFMSRKKVILIGWLLFVLSIFLVGTSPMLKFTDNSTMIWYGMLLLGFGAA